MSDSDRTEIPEPVVETDDEPINLQDTDSNIVDTNSDVALLELEPDVPDPQVSLEDPPVPDSEPIVRSHHSRSRSRSRRRAHRHRQPRWRNRFQLKRKESNFVAAACNMVVVVLLCTAMAVPQWIYIKGGGCRHHISKAPVHFLGLSQFFYLGEFIYGSDGHGASYTYYKYGPDPEAGIVDCVTPQALQVIRGMIALCSIGVIFTIMSFTLDLHGPSIRVLKSLQRHAILSMCTVGICVAVTGFCYWTTQILKALQMKTKSSVGSKIEVEFSIGFYLVAAAGSAAVIAVGCNVLRRPSSLEEEDRQRILQDIENYYPTDLHADGTAFPMPPPPPPYQP